MICPIHQYKHCYGNYWRAWIFQDLYLVGATNADGCTQRDKESKCHWPYVTIQLCRKGLPITIIMQDETWVHHFKSKSKWQLMECYHTISPRKKKFKSTLSTAKIMVKIFWVEKRWTSCLQDNSELLTLHWNSNKSECLASWVCPTRKMSQTVASSRTKLGHTEARTTQAIIDFSMTVLPRPPYSPDFAPSH
jgi:hypothetical protein